MRLFEIDVCAVVRHEGAHIGPIQADRVALHDLAQHPSQRSPLLVQGRMVSVQGIGHLAQTHRIGPRNRCEQRGQQVFFLVGMVVGGCRVKVTHDGCGRLCTRWVAAMRHQMRLQALQGLTLIVHFAMAYHNKKTKSKSELVDEVRRVIRASLGNRAKEDLLVDFINKTDLDQIGDKASVIEAFFSFAQAEQQREAQELINSESLNAEAAKRYIKASLKREFASESGTELNALLPKMSPLNPQYLVKKQSVFQKLAAFVEKFKGVGGKI